MTKFLQDILRQPEELIRALEHLESAGQEALQEAADAILTARHVYITGIGASWHAALCAGSYFHRLGLPVLMVETSELLFAGHIPSDAVILALSRSGRSVEIVQLLAKAREVGASVIGVSNFEDGLLARQADLPVVIPATADHGISVITYSSLALAAAAIGAKASGLFDSNLTGALTRGIRQAGQKMEGWRQQLSQSSWLAPGAPYYFLARGSSLGSAYEAALLWEEAGKSPSAAMSTGSFRHGPQEIVTQATRIAMWIDGEQMRTQDLTTARDLRQLGASVMLIGQNLSKEAGDLVFEIPEMPTNWQFLTDIIPAQLAAEAFAQACAVDCDAFRFASYIVEDDSGIAPKDLDRSVSTANTVTGTEDR